MYLIRFLFLILGVIYVMAEAKKRKKLRDSLFDTNEPEEIEAFQKAISSTTGSINLVIVTLILYAILLLILSNLPTPD